MVSRLDAEEFALDQGAEIENEDILARGMDFAQGHRTRKGLECWEWCQMWLYCRAQCGGDGKELVVRLEKQTGEPDC